jgi:NADP-dependent 3-hydroxy acid dehydrogenase YdfG
MTDPRHLLLVGTGPGLGAAVARRFAREEYRLTLVARSEETIATIAQELRASGTDVTVVAADTGDPTSLRGALSLLFAARAPRASSSKTPRSRRPTTCSRSARSSSPTPTPST